MQKVATMLLTAPLTDATAGGEHHRTPAKTTPFGSWSLSQSRPSFSWDWSGPGSGIASSAELGPQWICRVGNPGVPGSSTARLRAQ